jgi:hypothetical protein
MPDHFTPFGGESAGNKDIFDIKSQFNPNEESPPKMGVSKGQGVRPNPSSALSR